MQTLFARSETSGEIEVAADGLSSSFDTLYHPILVKLSRSGHARIVL
jgi:hypothetical protein